MTSETCAKCGHPLDIHEIGIEHGCCNVYCKCKKFIPQNHSPQIVNKKDKVTSYPFEDTEPEEDTSKNEVLIKSSGSDDECEQLFRKKIRDVAIEYAKENDAEVYKTLTEKDDASSLSDKIFLEKEWIGDGGGIATKDVKESVKKLKNGIEQMKRDVITKNLNDEEIDFWMDRLETPVIKLIDKIFGSALI